jgi:hypothetical protein
VSQVSEDQIQNYDSNKHRDHFLEQYKLYIEMADRISQRRALANTFFLTLHTGLFGLAIGLAGASSGSIEFQAASLAGSLFGLPFVYVWRRILSSYRQINAAKYLVIHELEEHLPVAPYRLEWEKTGKGEDPRLYMPLTKVEGWVPIVFGLAYLAATALALVLITGP